MDFSPVLAVIFLHLNSVCSSNVLYFQVVAFRLNSFCSFVKVKETLLTWMKRTDGGGKRDWSSEWYQHEEGGEDHEVLHSRRVKKPRFTSRLVIICYWLMNSCSITSLQRTSGISIWWIFGGCSNGSKYFLLVFVVEHLRSYCSLCCTVETLQVNHALFVTWSWKHEKLLTLWVEVWTLCWNLCLQNDSIRQFTYWVVFVCITCTMWIVILTNECSWTFTEERSQYKRNWVLWSTVEKSQKRHYRISWSS